MGQCPFLIQISKLLFYATIFPSFFKRFCLWLMFLSLHKLHVMLQYIRSKHIVLLYRENSYTGMVCHTYITITIYWQIRTDPFSPYPGKPNQVTFLNSSPIVTSPAMNMTKQASLWCTCGV